VLPLSLLWISLGLAWITGLIACTSTFVDDEIRSPVRSARESVTRSS
jgi:hypothetical protein